MFDKEAHEFIEAVKALAQSDVSCERLESYLAHHFPKWLEKFASTPEGITEELKSFTYDDLSF